MSLDKLQEQIRACDDCGINRSKKLGEGKKDATIIFIGESAVNAVDPDDPKYPIFGDMSRGAFDSLLERCELTREDIWLTNTIKCTTKGLEKDKDRLMRNCNLWLLREVVKFGDCLIIPLGNLATVAMLGDSKAKPIMQFVKSKTTFAVDMLGHAVGIVPFMHPSVCIHGYPLQDYLAAADYIAKAIKLWRRSAL